MKSFVLSGVLLLIAITLCAQPEGSSLLNLNQTRLEITRIHAYVLGGWAFANIIIGGYLTYKLEDGVTEAFHHMNAAWNLVNLGVAWTILHQANYSEPETYNLATSIAKHFQTQKLMMLNVGLDVSYTLAGLLLYEHSKNAKRLNYLLKGFGISLMMQGGFLLLLDITFYSIYSSYNNELWEILNHNSLK